MELRMVTVLLTSLLLTAAAPQQPSQITTKPNANGTINVCDILNGHCHCTSRGDKPSIICQFSAQLQKHPQTLLQADELKTDSEAPSTQLSGGHKAPSTQLGEGRSEARLENYIIDNLDISNCDLSSLSDNFLVGISHIKTLTVQNCRMTQVPKALLTVRHVRELDLSQNNLTDFSLDSVASLAVRKLILDFNNISTMVLSGDLPKKLAILHASNNQLKDLPLALWQTLHEIHITDNMFTRLPKLPAPSQLKILDVSDNFLTQFPMNFLTALPSLQTLKLARNRIHLPSQTLTESDTDAGRSGSLRRDEIHNATGSIQNTKPVPKSPDAQLCTRRFRNSSCIPPSLNLNRLQHLDLSGNNIQHMTPGLLANFPRLLGLDLGDNNLTSLRHDHNIFPQHSSRLHSLNLSRNALVHLHPDTFLHLQRLRDLDLSHNPGLGHVGVTHVKFPEHLMRLDLGHCSMEHVDYCQLSRLHDLTYLDLTHNRLRCTCYLQKLYTWYRSSNRARRAGSEITGNWQCLPTNGKTFVSVATLPCPDEIQCLSADPLPAMHDVSVTVNVLLADHNLITSWTMSDVPSQIHGFRVLYSPKHSADGDTAVKAAHVSPILGVALRSYTVMDIEHEKSYTVCLDMLANETSILKRVCKTVNADLPNAIVGILAGVTFLIPCVVFVVYIYFKDKSIQQKELHDKEDENKIQRKKSAGSTEEEEHKPLCQHLLPSGGDADTEICGFPSQEPVNVKCAFPSATNIKAANEMLGIRADAYTNPQYVTRGTTTKLSFHDTDMADSLCFTPTSGSQSGQLGAIQGAYFIPTSSGQFSQGATNHYNTVREGEAKMNAGSTPAQGGTHQQDVHIMTTGTNEPMLTFGNAERLIPTFSDTNELTPPQTLPPVRQDEGQGSCDPVSELDELVAELQALIENEMK